MKKTTVIVAAVLLILAIAGGGYWYYQNEQVQKDQAKKQAELAAQKEVTGSIAPEPIKRAGEYSVYSADKLAHATDGKVVLFFYASWSRNGKQLDKELSQNVAKLPKNFTILKVDYNRNFTLRKQYAVEFENSFVQVDAAGAKLNMWSGSEYLEEIIAYTK